MWFHDMLSKVFTFIISSYLIDTGGYIKCPKKHVKDVFFHVMSYAFLFHSENGKMGLFKYFYYENGAFQRKTRD